MKKIVSTGLLMMCAVTTAYAADVKVSEAWARASAPGQSNTMVQAVITSRKDAKLVGASCKDANTTEIHSMVMDGELMKMRQVEAVDLPAGKAVDLGKEGYHLMLIGLKKPLTEGKKTKCELAVRTAEGKEKKVKMEAKVKPLAESGGHEHMHHH